MPPIVAPTATPAVAPFDKPPELEPPPVSGSDVVVAPGAPLDVADGVAEGMDTLDVSRVVGCAVGVGLSWFTVMLK